MSSSRRYPTQRRPLRALAAFLTATSLVACEGNTPVEPPAEELDLTTEGLEIDLSGIDLPALGDIGVLIGVTPRPDGLAAAPEDEPQFSPFETSIVLFLSVEFLFDNGFISADDRIFLLVPVVDAFTALQAGDEAAGFAALLTFAQRVATLFTGGTLVLEAAQFLVDLAVSALVQLVNVPEVVATTPVDGATAVDPATTLTIAFSEQVDITASGVTLECPAGTPIPFGGLPAAGTSNVGLTPTSPLPGGVTCVGTVLATQVTDTDGTPDNMAADFAFSFTTPHAVCSSQTQIPVLECDALAALFESTNGPGWTNNTGWLASLEPCGWFGVTCSLGNVTEVSLFSNQLVGVIPPELGSLSNLNILILSNNQLTGVIPPQLGNLTNLTVLAVSNSQLTGVIPPQLGNLINLTEVFFTGNQLTGVIPPELGNLVNLTLLRLGDNQLTGVIPPELGNLINLIVLSLDTNQLTGVIPPQLGGLINLTGLILDNNQLTGVIPPELGNLTNLTGLRLNNNQLTGVVPPELGNLTNLTLLTLADNQLTGVIPPELGNLTNLTALFLKSNQLTGIVPLGVAEIGANASFCDMTGNTLTIPATPEYLNLTTPPGQPICGLIPGTTWYFDGDGDGFGDLTNSVIAPSQPFGFVADNSDCDDSRPIVFPGAPGTGEGIDNNCDGVVTGDELEAVAMLTQHTGVVGDGSVEPGFAAASSGHVSEFIDFDGDGFDGLVPHTFTPIPTNHYAAQGVTLLGLDARSVGVQPWAHSPPIGAWPTGWDGFRLVPEGPYSFVFDLPLASFGMFANDVEAPVSVTVHLTGGGTESFTLPASGGASTTIFHGFTAVDNVISRIDFSPGDFHIIDDVQFGRR